MKKILILSVFLIGCIEDTKENTIRRWEYESLLRNRNYYERRIFQISTSLSPSNSPEDNDVFSKQRMMFLDSTIKYQKLINEFEK